MKNNKKLNIIIAGGGTGGHLYPGIAVAEIFINENPENKILFLNTGNNVEKRILNFYKFNYKKIPSSGFFGKNLVEKIKSIKKILLSVKKAIMEIKNFQTDAILGVGGYVSVPVLIAAIIKRIPFFIQEQNSVPGIANKIFSFFSVYNFVSFETTKLGVQKKRFFTGNPVRSKIIPKIKEKSGNEKISVFITGGSQGASAINKTFCRAIDFIEHHDKLEIIHQTGKKDLDFVVDTYKKKSIKNDTRAFFDDIYEIYQKTDIIVARSGASTISEITCAGIPSILIPFPFATHNHQFHNAKNLMEKGAAIIIEEKNLSEKLLAQHINDLIKKPENLKKMGKRALSLAKPDAAYEIYNKIQERMT
ncbi:MAG: undecaprenyldiphospho-muramoylpentapeptide beta-N-acetylglucosaminyltransferase [Deltaproteobacteria bacterium]|nr:MAG: undecaprenyldiphospho-muramoylpentapeptide beta-N-acetylglucosaminyltransferase [Deltaproteobacteria bacterium]